MNGDSCKRNSKGVATCGNPIPFKLMMFWKDVTCPECLKSKSDYYSKYMLYYKQELKASRAAEPIKISEVDIRKLKKFWDKM